MPTTTHYGFHAPAGSNIPDVPADILLLAQDVDAALWAEKAAREGVAATHADDMTAVKGTGWVAGMTIKDLYSKVPTTRIKYGYTIMDPGAAGDATLVHNAGWVGSHFLATCAASSSSNPVVVALFDLRVNNSTQVGMNFWDVKNNAPWTTPIGVSWTVRD